MLIEVKPGMVLISLIMTLFEPCSTKKSTRDELLKRVNVAADFICSHYAAPITLTDIAAAAALSKFHLVRLFRQIHGASPHQFLTRKRLAAAGRLLDRPELSLDDVALLSGFGTRWSLFRQLRRTTGEGGAALRRLRARDGNERARAAEKKGSCGAPL